MDRGEFLNIINQSNREADLFWDNKYPKLSESEKILLWLSLIHKGMRGQGEIGNNIYTQFTPKWYEWALSVEQNFDAIFKKVVSQLGYEFDWHEFQRRIKE